MREPVYESELDNLVRDTNYEKACPVCDECGLAMTAEDYYYDIDGHLVCPECTDTFLENYRKSIISYLERNNL